MRKARALVAVALIGPALANAESGVTLYGVVDTYVEYVKSGSTNVARLEDGGLYQSRWGLRGKEELGNDLAAVFALEAGLAVDTGTLQQGGRLFGRQSWAGLSSLKWGALTFGRQNTPIYYIEGAASAFGFSPYGPLGRLQNGGPAGSSLTARADNSIRFESADYGGLQASLLYSFGSERATAPRDADRIKALGLTYGRGPLWLGLAYERTSSIGAVDGMDRDERAIGASYDFTLVRLYANVRQAILYRPAQAELRDRGWHVGMTVPVGANGMVLLAYGTQWTTGTGNRGDQLSFGYQYFVSKRTTLYANASKIWNTNLANYTFSNIPNQVSKTGVSDPRGVMAGIRHLF